MKQDFKIGDKVIWLFGSSYGYGLTTRVKAIIVGFGKKRIKVLVDVEHQSHKKPEGQDFAWVSPEKLRKREE